MSEKNFQIDQIVKQWPDTGSKLPKLAREQCGKYLSKLENNVNIRNLVGKSLFRVSNEKL